MEWVYGIGGSVVLGWVSWVSWEALQNHGLGDRLDRMNGKLDRVGDKLDRLIERFL